MSRLKRSFFERSAVDVARDLVGRVIVRHIGRQPVVGVIVETAAYETSHGENDAAHPGAICIARDDSGNHELRIVAGERGAREAVSIRAMIVDEDEAIRVGDASRVVRELQLDPDWTSRSICGPRSELFIHAQIGPRPRVRRVDPSSVPATSPDCVAYFRVRSGL